MRDGAPLTIREATADDATVLAELIAEFNGPQGDARETAGRLAACQGLEVALLAWVDGATAGFACLRVTPAIGDRDPHALLTELYVREAYINEGPRLKRFRAAAMGRAAPRIKRTSQVTIVVDRKE